MFTSLSSQFFIILVSVGLSKVVWKM